MSDKDQMIEQIFSSVDSLGSTLETTVDLNQDVAPFMFATLAKIKQLALARSNNYEANYELFQIATNYLPRTIHAYCSLPMEYRNTRIIKHNKTARQFLITDLEIFKKQVFEIEKQFYSEQESQIKVNSSFIREKYDNTFQLATEVEQMEEQGFVNKFDYAQYQNSDDYRKIIFTREPSQKEVQAKERSDNINKAFNTGKKIIPMIFSAGVSVIKKIGRMIANFWYDYSILVILLTGVGSFITLFVSLISNEQKPVNLYYSLRDSAKEIHEVMKVTVIPHSEFTSFVNTRVDQLIDDSSYRKDHIKVVYNEKTNTMIVNATDFSKARCLDIIDNKENSFDSVDMKINGINLPQDNTVSDHSFYLNQNHTLCHLENGNKITLTFDNNKIFNAQKIDTISNQDKVTKISNMQKEIDSLNAEVANHNKEGENYKVITKMIQQVSENMNKIKALPITN